MGGLVTTAVGSTHQDEVAGMILMYPALSARTDSGAERYKSEDEMPEDAKGIIPDCEFYVIKNGGHEFFGQPFEDAVSYILPYLDRQLNSKNTESEGTETILQMKIGDTGVTVNWEDIESSGKTERSLV